MKLFLRLFVGFAVQIAPFALLCLEPFGAHLRFSKRKTFLLTALWLVLLCAIFSSVSCWLDEQMPDEPAQFMAVNIVFYLCLLPCIAWYVFAVRVDWHQKLFTLVFALTGALTVTSVQNAFWADSSTLYMPYEHPTLLWLAVTTALILPLLILLLRVCYLPVADGLNAKEAGALNVVSMLLFIILASGLTPMEYEQLQHPTTRMLYLTLIVSVLVIYAAVFRMLFHAHRRFETQQALAQTAHQLEMSREQYKRMMDNITATRRLQHDLRHHALVLQGMLNENRLEEAQTYLSQHMENVDAQHTTRVCDNMVVDLLVNYYIKQANNAQVSCKTRVQIPAQTAVDDGDMAVLLGNLLENAICAAKSAKPDDRVVTLSIITSGTMLAITVDNGYHEPLCMRDGCYCSTKPNHTGIGIASIESIAEKYGGGVEFSHDATRFHASVLLNISCKAC